MATNSNESKIFERERIAKRKANDTIYWFFANRFSNGVFHSVYISSKLLIQCERDRALQSITNKMFRFYSFSRFGFVYLTIDIYHWRASLIRAFQSIHSMVFSSTSGIGISEKWLSTAQKKNRQCCENISRGNSAERRKWQKSEWKKAERKTAFFLDVTHFVDVFRFFSPSFSLSLSFVSILRCRFFVSSLCVGWKWCDEADHSHLTNECKELFCPLVFHLVAQWLNLMRTDVIALNFSHLTFHRFIHLFRWQNVDVFWLLFWPSVLVFILLIFCTGSNGNDI